MLVAALLLLGPAGARSATAPKPGAANSVTVSQSTTPAPKPATTSPAKTKPAARKPTSTTPATPKPAAPKPAKPQPAKPKPKPAKPKPAPAKPKPAPKPIGGYLANATFPQRALVLSVPHGLKLTAGQVHVTENGSPVGPLIVTPISQANAGDFGIVLVIDQNWSMSGTPLTQAMAAARTIAAQRTAQQELALITFDARPYVLLAPTSNQGAIDRIFATTAWNGAGGDVPPALTLALKQLSHAKVAAGAVILISDGAGLQGAGGPTQLVAAAAQAAHVPIITVGLQDASATASSMQQLAQIGGGQFVQAAGSNLSATLTKIVKGLTNGYVVRYRSQQPPGQQVAVTASVDGAPGTVNVSYTAPLPPAPHVRRPKPHRAAAHPGKRRSSVPGRLAPSPAFALPAPPSSRSFWASSTSALFVSGACALLIALAVLILLLRRPSKRAVQARVGNFIPGPADSEEGALDLKSSSNNALMRRFERGRRWPEFVEDVGIARSPHSPLTLVKRAALAGLIAALALTLISGSLLIGLLPLLAWPFVLRAAMRRAARKQRERFRELLPSHLQDLGGAMRAGRSVVGAIASVAESADEPIKSELDRAVTDDQLGRPMEESLKTIATRMQAVDMDQVALVAALNRRSGSNVAESIERVAEGARERADLRREMKALTGQAKMSSMVLTGLPPMMLLGMTVLAPQYAHPLFHTTAGVALLVIGTLMVFSGWKVMMRIVNIDP